MYVPEAFRVDDLSRLHDFIEANSFGILASAGDAHTITATHLPFLLDRKAGEHGALIAHVARENCQWRSAADQDVLAIFPGPHAYISPAWYESDNVVPTWNYVTVHAYGKLTLIDDDSEVLGVLADFVNHHERDRPQPWPFEANTAFARKLAQMVVAFRIEITRLEGKWKLNQNHTQERRDRVAARLSEQGDENSLAIAQLMQGKQ